jgi:hypothetical protein
MKIFQVEEFYSVKTTKGYLVLTAGFSSLWRKLWCRRSELARAEIVSPAFRQILARCHPES